MALARAPLVRLSVAVLAVATPGCVSGILVEGIEKNHPTRQFHERIDRVTIAPDAQGKLALHVLVRLDDGRAFHYVGCEPGCLAVVDGPLPPSVVQVIVASRCSEGSILAVGDPIWRANRFDGALTGPISSTEVDLQAFVVLVRGCTSEDLAFQVTWLRVSVVAPTSLEKEGFAGAKDRAFSLGAYEENSTTRMAANVGLGLLLPVAAAIDLVAFPIELVAGAIVWFFFPPFI